MRTIIDFIIDTVIGINWGEALAGVAIVLLSCGMTMIPAVLALP